jgi:predicted protein tyrosine phosphatase
MERHAGERHDLGPVHPMLRDDLFGVGRSAAVEFLGANVVEPSNEASESYPALDTASRFDLDRARRCGTDGRAKR